MWDSNPRKLAWRASAFPSANPAQFKSEEGNSNPQNLTGNQIFFQLNYLRELVETKEIESSQQHCKCYSPPWYMCPHKAIFQGSTLSRSYEWRLRIISVKESNFILPLRCCRNRIPNVNRE